MEIKAREKTGLLMFGFVFAWAALFLMLATFFGVLPPEGIAGFVFLILFAIFGVLSSLFLGVGFGAEFVESKAS